MRNWVAVLAAGVLVTGTWGCKGIKEKLTEKVAEKVTEKIVESGTGGQADIDTQSGTVTIKGEDGSSFTVSSKNAKLPDGWPSDMPLYPGELKASMRAQGNDGRINMNVTLEVKDPPAKVLAFYAGKLASMKKVSEMNAGQMSIVNFESDQRLVSVTLISEDKKDTSMLTLVVVQKKS